MTKVIPLNRKHQKMLDDFLFDPRPELDALAEKAAAEINTPTKLIADIFGVTPIGEKDDG